MRFRNFTTAAGILVAFWLIMEVFYGFSRSPIDDRWTGDVSVVNLFTPTKVDATMTMDFIDPGFIMNRRPEVDAAGARFTFDGPQANTLQKLGIQTKFFEDPERWKYSQGFCALKYEKHRGSGVSWINGNEDVRKVAILSYDPDTANCFNFELGVVDFDHIEFMIVKPGQTSLDRKSLKDVVYVELKRDSRVSFIQRLIMRARFSSWVDDPSIKKA